MLLHVPTGKKYSSKLEARRDLGIGDTKFKAKIRDKEILYFPDEETSTPTVNEKLHDNK